MIMAIVDQSTHARAPLHTGVAGWWLLLPRTSIVVVVATFVVIDYYLFATNLPCCCCRWFFFYLFFLFGFLLCIVTVDCYLVTIFASVKSKPDCILTLYFTHNRLSPKCANCARAHSLLSLSYSNTCRRTKCYFWKSEQVQISVHSLNRNECSKKRNEKKK